MRGTISDAYPASSSSSVQASPVIVPQPPKAQGPNKGASDREETVFYVLGMLNEYAGRGVVNGDSIEGFYCDEHSSADAFERALRRMAVEQQLDPSIRRDTSQGCLVSFHSSVIAERLNSCYVYQPSGVSSGQEGTSSRKANRALNFSLFFAADTGRAAGSGFQARRALAYLAGAWIRFRHGNDFRFANAHDKAVRIGNLLTNLGCLDVRLESDFGRAPQTNLVHFTPTDELKRALQTKWFQ